MAKLSVAAETMAWFNVPTTEQKAVGPLALSHTDLESSQLIWHLIRVNGG